MRRLCIAIVLLTVAGCSTDDPAPQAKRAKPDPLHSYNGRVIRGWLLSLDRDDYGQAAYYFARNALIDQGHPYRLKSESEAFAFNASLPCRADLIAMTGGGHARQVLATFRLRRGPGGKCSGLTRVRYTIENGKFTVWRQLPDIEENPA
jgi:hypothetical protein